MNPSPSEAVTWFRAWRKRKGQTRRECYYFALPDRVFDYGLRQKIGYYLFQVAHLHNGIGFDTLTEKPANLKSYRTLVLKEYKGLQMIGLIDIEVFYEGSL